MVCGGSKCIGRPEGRTALPLLSFLSDQKFLSSPKWQAPFPLEFRNNNAELENHSGRVTKPRKKFDDIFSHLDTISDILVLKLISVLVFILFSRQNFYYPRQARSAIGVDIVLTLDVCMFVC